MMLTVACIVRDDGDVDAYLVRHVQQAIERRLQPENSLGQYGADVRPFFQRNVGKSAWGLAIHSEARMIAVSSNKLEITVFTFALVQDELTDPDDDCTDEERIYYSGSAMPPSDRKKNDVRVIQNGNANIPSIAFCNVEGQDPTGKWLVSTDISGVVRSWNTHTLCRVGAVLATVQPISRTHDEVDFSSVSNFDRWNAGWSIMFLQPRSFRRTRTLREALGLPSINRQIDGKDAIWDISSSVRQVRGNANRFAHRLPIDVVDGNYHDPLGIETSLHATSTNAPVPNAMSSHQNMRAGNVDGASDVHRTAQWRDGDVRGLAIPEDDDSDSSSDDAPAYLGRPQFHFQGTNSLCPKLRCPVLAGSVSTLYLFQPPRGASAQGHAPVITLNNLFGQELPLEYYDMGLWDRCNMCAQIEQLGVIVVATQKGRVAIISLTQIESESSNAARSAGAAYRRVYGFRIDHILPYASQEAAGHRPPSLLHGIAVGPMQGTEDASDQMKRWRLLVMYQDHSVLSYEIGRSEDTGVGTSGVNVII